MQEANTFVTLFKFQNIVHIHKEHMVYYGNLTCGKMHVKQGAEVP